MVEKTQLCSQETQSKNKAAEAEAQVSHEGEARAAQRLVDKVKGEEGGSLLASYAVKHDDLRFDEDRRGPFGEVWRGMLRGARPSRPRPCSARSLRPAESLFLLMVLCKIPTYWQVRCGIRS